jgi:ApaG protein
MQSSPPASSRRPACRGSESSSNGFRIAVFPTYLPDHSDPEARQFIFGYRIRIANESQITAQLLLRHWTIVDAHGRSNEVQGEGVVGQQPILRPGQSFEYSSFCPLPTAWGTMEGHYVFQREGDEAIFEVPIARFYLVAPSETN